MNRIIQGTEVRKFALALLVALAVCFSAGAQLASADLTVAALAVTSSGALTVEAAAASNTIYNSAQTSGTIALGGTAGTGTITVGSSSGAQTLVLGGGAGISTVQIAGGSAANVVTIANVQTAGSVTVGAGMTTGTIAIGGTAGTGAITVGASTGTGQTVNIGSGATTGSDIVNIGTGTATTLKTVNIATGAISAVNIGTGNFVNTIAIGSHATPINVITLGGAASTLTIGATLLGGSPLVFEAATANAFEATLAVADVTADVTYTLPDRTGQVQLASACSAITAGATPTLTINLSNCYTDTITTDNQDQTITFSAGGTAGDMITVVFITDTGGSGDEVITFHTTLANTTGTLTLANLTAGRYTVTFMSDGTVWNEVARTAAQT